MSQNLNIERNTFLELINFDKSIVKAKGLYLYDNDNKKYLDFTTQFGAVAFGHNPDFLWQAITEQQAESPGLMIQPFYSEGAKALANSLINIAPGNMKYVTFGCTGAEVVEIAIKMAKAKTGREGILSTRNSFHGKTMAAVLATGNEYYRECFYPSYDAFAHVAYDDLDALEEALSTLTFAAFIVEPIQGEGGMITPQPGYLKGCEQLCKKYGTLFVVDEVQTGLGRTGKLFACEYDQAEPDILLVAKALSGGMIPVSACLATKKAWSRNFGQRHSSTFANNHLAAVAGCAVINKLTQNPEILANVKHSGSYLSTRLFELVERYPQAFRECHGLGLMQGLALENWVDEESYLCPTISAQGLIVPVVSAYLLNRHNILTMPTLNNSNVLRLQPSYYVTEQEIDLLINALNDVGNLISQGKFSELVRATIGLEPESKPVLPRPFKNKPITPKGPKLGTFCFFVHQVTPTHTIECMPGGQNAYTDEEIKKALKWMDKVKTQYNEAAPVYYMPCIPSENGGYVDGWLISSLLTPKDMMRLPKDQKAQLMKSYIDAAQSKGADVIGLGAFTSVITRSGTTVMDCGTPVTTGNSFTAMTTADSIRKISEKKGIPLDHLTIGIVGASGSVGRLCLLDIGAEFKQINLIGNARNRNNVDKLEVVAGEFLLKLFSGQLFNPIKPVYQAFANINTAQIISEHRIHLPDEQYPADAYRNLFRAIQQRYQEVHGNLNDFPIQLSNSIERTLPECNVVITATSNGEAFIRPELLAENAIVCDVARPSDLLHVVKQGRRDVTAYDGGLVRLPADLRFGAPNVVLLESGVTLACLAETIILTMSQAKKNYSIGGVSPIEEAREVLKMAKTHGFHTYLDSKNIRSTGLIE